MNAEEVRKLSDAELELLADTIQTEQDRRWRKREKQAVKDAMSLERAIADYVEANPPEPMGTPFLRHHR